VIALLCAIAVLDVGNAGGERCGAGGARGARQTLRPDGGGRHGAGVSWIANGDWSAFHPALVARESLAALVYLTVRFGSIVAL